MSNNDNTTLISVLTGGIKGYQAYQQGQVRDDQLVALQEQSEMEMLRTNEKTLANYDILQKTLDAQTAALSVRGVDFSSPSFNAIQRNTENIAAQRQRNIDLEGNIVQENIDIERRNVKDKYKSDIFGDITSMGEDAFNIFSKMPTAG